MNLSFRFVPLILLLFTQSNAYAASVQFSSPTAFGKVPIKTSKTQTFTLTNNSSAQVRLDSYWFKNSKHYKVVGGTCQYNQNTGFILSAYKQCNADITFTPTVTGLLSDSWIVGYFLGTSWSWQEASLNLSGEGVLAAQLNCSFNGQTIISGSNVTAYSTANVSYGQTCVSESRVCNNGELSGSFANSTCSITSAPVPTPTPIGWLNVQGNKIVNDQGQQVILKGVNIADPEHLNTKSNERPGISARIIANAATETYHAQVVRLPILPGNPSYPTEGFFGPINGREIYFKKHIEPLVNELTSKGIYVIIDLHYISDYQNLFPQVKEFWTFMAPKFNNNPYVIYEIFNEPILPDNWTTWKNTIAQPATDLIRAIAPNNLILVGGPYWSSHMAGAATNPVTGKNIVYVAHVYSNQSLATWEKQYTPVINKYPLFVTEWGFEQGGTEGGTLIYGQQFESWMRSKNLSWTVWSFDILWGPRMFNSDWTLKNGPAGMGTFIRELLLEQKQSN